MSSYQRHSRVVRISHQKIDNATLLTHGSVKGMSIVVQKTPTDSSFAMEYLQLVAIWLVEKTLLINFQQDM